MTAVTSVVIVDDETLVRYGFELILGAAADIDVVATAGDVDAVRVIREHAPDVVLLDVRMPRVNGLEILRELQTFPDPPAVAMLTTFDTDEYVGQAMELGAAGFLLKDTDPEGLAGYVRVLARGGVVLAPGVDRSRLFAARSSGRAAPPALSVREHAVIRLVADGVSNPEIGQRLGVSTGTVKEDVRSLLAAFGVPTRVQLRAARGRGGTAGWLSDARPVGSVACSRRPTGGSTASSTPACAGYAPTGHRGGWSTASSSRPPSRTPCSTSPERPRSRPGCRCSPPPRCSCAGASRCSRSP
ncbi:response regulator [Curtobacterium flaccumfaciens]|nr:response regulator [Curtobacterium flaccumfaciens]